MRGEIFIEKILFIIAYFARGHYANDWIYRYTHTSAGNIEGVVFRREGIYIKIFFSAMETRIRDEIIFFSQSIYYTWCVSPRVRVVFYFFLDFFSTNKRWQILWRGGWGWRGKGNTLSLGTVTPHPIYTSRVFHFCRTPFWYV